MKFSSNFENKLFLWMKIMIWHTFQKPNMKFPDFSLTFAPFQNFPDIISNSLTIPWPWKNKIFPDFSLTCGNPVIYIYINNQRKTYLNIPVV